MTLCIVNFDNYSKEEINNKIKCLTKEPYTKEELDNVQFDVEGELDLERVLSTTAFHELFGRNYLKSDKSALLALINS